MGIFMLLLAMLASAPALAAAKPNTWVLEEEVELGRVPSEFPVGFCLLSSADRQYVAYYDHERRMTVASRKLGAGDWQRKTLPSEIGWDSHNYVTMALDALGQLHVSGNMHNDSLVYFRTTRAGDIASLSKAPMTGEKENRVTYPRFMEDAQGCLLFTYRHGGSGKGINLWNRYDAKSRSWSRLLDVPLFDGQGKTNAYPSLPRRHGDFFHTIWVWRDTPDCATNHHLSYARSRDMVHWESAFGDKLKLPITIEYPSLWVDPAPAGSGMINGGQRLGFDSAGKPVVVYHHEDNKGHMQIYAARPERGKWVKRALTKWTQAVPFGGNGSMPFIGIRLGEISRVDKQVLSIDFRHKDYGSGHIQFDEEKLVAVDEKPPDKTPLPAKVYEKQGDFPGLTIRRQSDLGSSGEEGVHYMLVWETLGSNHDKPRQPPLPEPSMLRLCKLREVPGAKP